MHLATRRVFRLSVTTSVSLAVSYGLALTVPFLAPLFAFMLTSAPRPPVGLKGLLGLLLGVALMLGVGLLLIPIVQHYPVTGLVLVFIGLLAANLLSLNAGKGPVGAVLTIGVALITMTGQVSYAMAILIVTELLIAIAIAIVCQWLVYPWFPEDPGPAPAAPTPAPETSKWLAARATLIVYPSFLLGLTDPLFYTQIIMKSVVLGQQVGETQLRAAGRELLGSTLVAALFAFLFWFCLKIAPTLWMFFLWTLLFSTIIAALMFGLAPSRLTPAFWLNVFVTMLIFVGPAVSDSANGKDPYMASMVRLGLFLGVTVYAWMAMVFLNWLRRRGSDRRRRAALAAAGG